MHRAAGLLFAVFVLIGCGGASEPDLGTEEEARARRDTNGTSVRTWILADSTSSAAKTVPFVPTDMPVVDRMLRLANVDEDDVVYDLGSGDGRIPIRAATEFGARAVGIEIDEQLVRTSRRNAVRAGVADRVEFRHRDLFDADISEATVVTLYLLRSVNIELRPKLFQDLEPGTPVVSQTFGMGSWEPDTTVADSTTRIHLWHVPERVPEDLQSSSDR